MADDATPDDWSLTEAALRGPAPPGADLLPRIEALRLADPRRLARLLEPALARPALQAAAWQAQLRLALGLCQANLRELDDALATFEAVPALAAEAQLPAVARRATEVLPWLLMWRGEFGAAARRLREAFAGALQAGDTTVLLHALDGLAMVASCTGRHERAAELLRQAELALQAAPTPVPLVQRLLHLHYQCIASMRAALDDHLAGRTQSLQRQLQAMAPRIDAMLALATEAGVGYFHQTQDAVRVLHATLADPSLQQAGPEPQRPDGRPLVGDECLYLAETLKARRRGDHAEALRLGERTLACADALEFGVQLAVRQEMALSHAALGQLQQAWLLTQESEAVLTRRDNESAAGELDAALDAVWRERGLAAALVGHDLRSPLTAIRALAQPQAAAGGAPAALAEIRQLAGRALLYADDFLQGVELQLLDRARFVPIALDATVAQAVDEVRHAADASATVEQQVPPGLVVMGEPQALHRALVNLMLNALQAAHEHGLPQRLLVSAARGTDSAVLSVRDHGPGVPASALRGLVDGLPPAAGRRNGFGLGLRNAAHCARALGGTLLAINHAEGGATVALSLPLVEAAAAA